MQLSQTDAALLLGAFSSVIVPFIYAWAKSNVIADWLKFTLAVVTCAVGGWLTAYAGGQIVDGDSIIQNGGKVAIAAGAIYMGIFRGLGLERVIFPRASIITDAQKSVAAQVGLLSKDTIHNAVDSTCPVSIHVSAKAIDAAESAPPVIPKG